MQDDLNLSDIVIQLVETKPNDNEYRIEDDKHLHIFIGDLILPSEYQCQPKKFYEEIAANFSSKTIQELRGFFYIIQFDKTKKIVNVINSIFSILPIYYHTDANFNYISSSLCLIRRNSQTEFTLNKKAILEKILFNYPLFDETFFNVLLITLSWKKQSLNQSQ